MSVEHVVRDYAHAFLWQTRSHLQSEPPRHYQEQSVEGKSPVLLVPGVFEKWGFMKSIGDTISQAGHPVYTVPKLGYNVADIPTAFAMVREIIIENDLRDVVLVAHSKGGLIGKYALIHDQEERISRLITIATPFSGSALAKVVPHRAIRDFHSQSAILQELQSHNEVNHKIVSIAPVFDNHMIAGAGSYLEGAVNITVPAKGHFAVLFDPKVGEQLMDLLAPAAS